jgi:hypothetical protein
VNWHSSDQRSFDFKVRCNTNAVEQNPLEGAQGGDAKLPSGSGAVEGDDHAAASSNRMHPN